MNVEFHSGLETIKEEEWDALLPANNIFHRYKVLQDLASSKVEGSELSFLLIKDQAEIIATVALCYFPLKLDLFIGQNSWIKWVKKRFPNIFTVRVLFCGTPISAGQKNIFKKSNYEWSTILPLVNNSIERIAKKEKISICIYKEFYPHDRKFFKPLSKWNFFEAFSLPIVELPLNFSSFDEYLKALKYSYRRQIKSSLKRINSTEPDFVEKYFESNKNESHPQFTVLRGNEIDVDNFYSLYLSVMDRAEVKLETINREFFARFFTNFSVHVMALVMVYQGRILGIFLLYEAGDELVFLWTGKSFVKDKFHTYQNLLTATVYYAINHNFSNLNLGQTSYYPKMKMGGIPHQLYIYCKSFNGFRHRIFKLMGSIIFPPTLLPQLKPITSAFEKKD